MKNTTRQLFAALALATGLRLAADPTVPAQPAPAPAPAAAPAAAADPAGRWTWDLTRGGKTLTYELNLARKDGKLSGTLKEGREELKVSDLQYQDGQLSFSAARSAAATSTATAEAPRAGTKYAGTVSGDTLTGTMERPGKNGKTRSSDWTATRSKS